MSLDVSPDGRTIVFDLLGDLYTVPISGGKATRITRNTSFSHQPRYSPDGRQLVYVSDRGGSENVWVSHPDGRQARQLSNLHGFVGPGAVTSPTWSPDGRTIVVSQRLGATRLDGASSAESWRWLLAAYDVATREMRWLSDTLSDRSRSALGPTFDPDGRTVYAALDSPFRPVPWQSHADWRIARIDVHTGRIQSEIGGNTGRVGMRPTISRDGRYLAYATSSGTFVGIRLRDLKTHRERWLVRDVLDNPPYLPNESRDLTPGYAFTPDCKALIVAYRGKIHRIEIVTGNASVIPFLADVKRELGPLQMHEFSLPDTAVRTRSVMQPALSPDGNRVAFRALNYIWVMDLPERGRPAGRPYRLTADSAIGEFYPSWSPDGRWIVYSTWVDGKGGGVRRARVVHDALTSPLPSERLTSDTAIYFHTAVAPDGHRVVAVRATLSRDRVLRPQADFTPFELSLVWVPAGGGRLRSITSLAPVRSLYRYPVDQVYFTADPTRIYVGFTSWKWNGTNRRTALAVRGHGSTLWYGTDPGDFVGVLSSDRRRAIVSRKDGLFELSVPAAETRSFDTVDLRRAQMKPLGAVGAAHRWGTALAPWISWSRDGRRALFHQGGSLFVGEVQSGVWTSFRQVDVPLMVPVDVPRATLLLRGARLVTMRGFEVIPRGDLVVRDNRILAVGPVGGVVVPREAQLLDLTGTTIIPGYVDLHDHMAFAKGVHPQQWWPSLVRLALGVTAARDPDAGGDNDAFAYQERERAGHLIGPRVFSTGLAYYGTDPPIRTLAEARDRIRPHVEHFRTETFKVYYDLSTDRKIRQLLSIALAEQKLNATAHTNGVHLALMSIIDGVGGVEHPPKFRIYDDVASLIARSGTIHTQTYSSEVFGSLNYMSRRYGGPEAWPQLRRFVPPSAQASACFAGCTGEMIPANGPVDWDNLLSQVRGAARIVANGGQIGMGSHGNMPGIGFHYEMWLHGLGGMPNHEVLRSATIVGATAIGHARDLGSLESGKLADLQVLGWSPLEDLHNTTSIRYVMKNGRLYQAADLAEIWPRRRPLASVYVWGPSSSTDTTAIERRGRPLTVETRRVK